MEDEIERLLRTVRAEDATRSRARVGALRDLAVEDATVDGIVHELADDARPVRLLVHGVVRTGTLVAAWSGGVVLAAHGIELLVRTDAIDVVLSPDGCRIGGDEHRPPERSWAALLHDHLETDHLLALTVGGAELHGRMVSIGRAVVVIDTDEGARCYVRTDAIDTVVLGTGTLGSSALDTGRSAL